MAALALLGGIYFIIAGIIGKGKAFTSKMGTPLTGKEFKAVKYTYIAVGVLLLIVAAVSAVQLLE
ncbi:MAG: hypothetical protein MRZ61_00155 [Oscillospiraceae bacterium]|nr:hypothetical protein [Oscillospiraceae bacterium]